MKTISHILFILILASVKVQSQTQTAEDLLDSAKALFRSEQESTGDNHKDNYHKIAGLLERSVQLNPKDAEARYFLGYTYSRINSFDGRSMVSMDKQLLLKSSEQFEKVIQLTPEYKGEVIVLDPYSKLTAEWGSMAMTYWHKNKADSALWAFREGKKRGGFSDYILGVNKKALETCSPNAILISSGDNFTIPLWYLQIAEGYRKDVSVIDISLLNTTWYPAYLSRNNITSFDLPGPVLDTIEYQKWKDSVITIGKFSWTVKPSYYEQFILRGDRVFLSLLRKNNFQRDIYFTSSFSEESRLSLKEYLTNYIVVDKLTPFKKTPLPLNQYKTSVTTFLQLSSKINRNSPDQINMYDNFRYNVFHRIHYLLEDGEKAKAKELFNLLEKYGSDKLVPYGDQKSKDYMDYLKEVL